jgi:uncharacterized protein (DUF2141 family)
MKKIAKITFVIVLIMCSLSFSVPITTNYTLTVVVSQLRNERGVVQFALYDKDGTIPDQNFQKYLKIAKSKIVHKEATVTFEQLPAGRYAVNILHDENEDGKIDKGFILPTEGVGFSNYETIGLTNRPKFSAASFDLNKDLTINVKVIYM